MEERVNGDVPKCPPAKSRPAKSHRVEVRNAGHTLDVKPGQTILGAAAAAGLPYPYSCRAGNCGTCRSDLIEGEVELEHHSRYALDPHERAAGAILACRAHPKTDCVVEWLGPEMPPAFEARRAQATITAVDDLAPSMRRLRVAARGGRPFDFAAGQYARLTFPGLPERDFSIASRPDEPHLDFLVKREAGGAVSEYVFDAEPGDDVEVEGPFGDTWLRTHHRGPILAVAGGSGIGQVLSIVATAVEIGLPQAIHLYFGVRTPEDVVLADALDALAARKGNMRVHIVLSEPGTDTAHRHGMVHEALAADFDDLEGFKAYMAGPPPMIEAAIDVVRTRRLRRQDLHADPFYRMDENERRRAAKGL